MNGGLIVLLTLLLGGGCGYFQYWMACVLGKKRWLLLLQPGLFAVISAYTTAWALSIDNLKGSPERLAGVPFAALLVCALIGWAMAARRRKKQ